MKSKNFSTVWSSGDQYIRAYAKGTGYVVETNLAEPHGWRTNPKPWDIAINGLTSFILAQLSEGIDVFNSKYRKAVQTSIDAIANHYGDD